jgi:cellulose biosynthesis protein BcsQ
VPLLSDLNSILTVSRIESSIRVLKAGGINAPFPFYVFNLFDEHNTRDQQARELIARQCGDRLLPNTIRHSQHVMDAIADRMTVVDHAPESDAAHDYLQLAQWLRKIAPMSRPVKAAGRWSEK